MARCRLPVANAPRNRSSKRARDLLDQAPVTFSLKAEFYMTASAAVEELHISLDMDPAVVRKIAQLRPGEYIELVSDQDPKILLLRLQESHGAQFDSWRLQSGPAVRRLRITKRDPDLVRTIADLLSADHQRLRETWSAGRYAVAECNLNEVHRAFSEFSLGLNSHMQMEEQILFPAIEERTGMRDAGPTAAMRTEHARFRKILARLTKALEWESCEAITRMLQSEPTTPEDLFNSHDLREERVLYPMADRLIAPEDKLKLIRAMQHF